MKTKKIIGMSIITLSLLAGGVYGSTQMNKTEAAEATALVGSKAALEDSSITVNEALQYAMQDEKLAATEYEAIIAKYGSQTIYENIHKAELHHIDLLKPLLEKYGVTLEDSDYSKLITLPDQLQDSYAVNVQAEKDNIAMYNKFINDPSIPSDVKDVFQKLSFASSHHQQAFENAVAGKTMTPGVNGKQHQMNGTCNAEQGMGNGNGAGQGKGMGLGNGYRNQQ
ncbi:DUF2202 domain-containing protein [Ectobacillus sp. sgz5001026]|uniref:DUF2202 domain-containing protein n=1 Tax=Ectobacillus sp. sgz5001026 TaxID=3242473 RepID=UPI0036D38EF4